MLPVPCPFLARSLPVPCLLLACSLPFPCVLLAFSMPVPCLLFLFVPGMFNDSLLPFPCQCLALAVFVCCSSRVPCQVHASSLLLALVSCPCLLHVPWRGIVFSLLVSLTAPCLFLARSLPVPCLSRLRCRVLVLAHLLARLLAFSLCPRVVLAFALTLLPRFSPRLCLCHCRLFFYTLFVALGFVLLSHFPCRCPCDVLALSSPCSSSLPSVPRFIVAVLAQLHNHFLPPPAGVYLTCRSPYKLFISRAQRLLFYCVFLW